MRIYGDCRDYFEQSRVVSGLKIVLEYAQHIPILEYDYGNTSEHM